MLNKFFTFIKSRYFIASLLFILCALAIWFLGPMIGLGDWHPLEPKLTRVALIIWLLVLAICMMAKWTLFPLVFITGVILIWFLTPLLSFSDSRPFESISARVILLGILLFIALIYGVIRLLKATQKDPELLNKLFRGKDKSQVDPEVNKRTENTEKKILWALSQLKISNLKNSVISRPFKKKNYLYAVPWFLSIGSTGSGKTTTLLNSGIQLTDSAQVRSSTAYLSINDDAPATDECNIWLSHEAVFVDTSGKYLADSKPETSLIWQGLLRSLKSNRPKTPINGVIVSVSVEEILDNTEAQNIKLAATLRERILQTKKELGVFFPVYFTITKTDKLIGFKEYFQSLTEEGRLHPWGFSLPVSKEFATSSAGTSAELTMDRIQQEMSILSQELEKNLLTRLEEESDLKDKQALYSLPEEFKSLSQKITRIIDTLFIESSFGLPELNQSLRGIFFVSAMQDDLQLIAKNDTILQRYENSVGELEFANTHAIPQGNKPFFIADLVKKTIVNEGWLVKPDREWQMKNTILRFLTYALVAVVFSWFAYSFHHSYNANATYLDSISVKTKDLDGRVRALYKNYNQDNIPDILDLAATLPNLPGWDLNNPLLERQYGLYMAEPVIQSANYAYTKLTDNLLLSQLINRMESVMRESVVAKNTTEAAEALNVYLMLNDDTKNYYNYKTIKSWVAKDWMNNSNQYNFGGKSSVFEHLNNLFVPDRVVKSPFLKNEELIREVRRSLETQSSSTRIYNRTKSIAQVDAPKDFTLTSVIGPDASTAFRFASGKNLDYAISGIYTYEGYHNVFKPKLKAIIAEAILNDRWLMGRANEETDKNPVVDLSLMDDIKKQYLTDYQNIWASYIADIDATTGDNLAYDINILRVYASPNSPLDKLAQAIVKETSLLQQQEDSTTKTLAAEATKNTNIVSEKTKNLGKIVVDKTLTQEALLEKTLVDDHFSDLRKMVTGQADFSNKNIPNASPNIQPVAATQSPTPTNSVITSLNGFNSFINELYLYVSVANTTITTGGIPPASTLNTRANFEADRLPAPFQRILNTLVVSSATKIYKEKETILMRQAQIQFDELISAYNTQVNTICKQNIAGKYPFSKNSSYEVAIDDFSQFFATNGTVDTFFSKNLSKYIDTSSAPWKYKTIEAINIQRALDSAQSAAPQAVNAATAINSNEPTLEGEYLKLLAKQGPSPEFFSMANDIKQAYFQENGQRLMVNYQYNIIDVDPMITELILNFDGNIQRYVHNPSKPQGLQWPSPKLSGAELEIIASPKLRADSSTVRYEGPWALFKFLDYSKMIPSTDSSKSLVELNFEGRRTLLEVTSKSSRNPLNTRVTQFKCF